MNTVVFQTFPPTGPTCWPFQPDCAGTPPPAAPPSIADVTPERPPGFQIGADLGAHGDKYWFLEPGMHFAGAVAAALVLIGAIVVTVNLIAPQVGWDARAVRNVAAGALVLPVVIASSDGWLAPLELFGNGALATADGSIQSGVAAMLGCGVPTGFAASALTVRWRGRRRNRFGLAGSRWER